MKAKKIVGTAVLVLVLTMNGMNVFAVSEEKSAVANSKVNIIVEANEEPTVPVNPVDPEKPVDPTQPIDPADPENPGTGNAGPLSIDYVPNIKFGIKEIELRDKVYNAINENPFIQVTDKRGTGAGWALTAQTQGFKTTTGLQLKGAEISFKHGEVKTRQGNTSTPAVGYDVTLNNTDSQVVMDAQKDAGLGTWLGVFSGNEKNNQKVQLKVLGGSVNSDKKYVAEINWTLANAPK